MPPFDVDFTPGQPICTITFSSPIELKSSHHPHQLASTRNELTLLSEHIKKEVPEIEELQFYFDLLKADAISIIHAKSVFSPEAFENIPLNMTDTSGDPAWFCFANSISALSNCFDIQMVSYASENSGNLFVHLVAQLGHDESSIKSLKELRGHTDGMIFPMSGDNSFDPELPKIP